jgi:hypothetical protein
MVHVPLNILSECLEFPSAPCLAGKMKLNDSTSLDVVEIRTSLDMLFSASVAIKVLHFGT